jgi:hypothetical protein
MRGYPWWQRVLAGLFAGFTVYSYLQDRRRP